MNLEVLYVGYGLATLLYGGYFVRLILKRRSLQVAINKAHARTR